MNTRIRLLGAGCLFGAALFGAGCSLPLMPSSASSTSTSSTPAVASGPKEAVFDGLSSQDATKKIQLTAGSVMEMRQGFGGIGGKVADIFGVGGQGVRDIVIDAFAPAHTASLHWKLTTQKDKITTQTTGSINDADLLRAHTLYLPGYWREGDQKALGTSVLWLSQDEYEDLAKLKNTSVDFGLFTPELVDSLPKDTDLQAAIQRVKDTAIAAGNKIDVYYVVADPNQTEQKLTINGKEVTVQVITARSWFGEIVVLANKQYPLVLKVTLNPIALAAVDSMSGSTYLSHAMGYEITELKDIQE